MSLPLLVLLEFGQHAPGPVDVLGLRAFVAAREQQHDHVSLLREVDAVAGAEVEPQLADPVPDGVDVAHGSAGRLAQTNPRVDPRLGLPVP